MIDWPQIVAAHEAVLWRAAYRVLAHRDDALDCCQEALLDADGDVLIPAGATLRGRVTRVAQSGNVGQTAVLNLALESISYGGKSYPIEASVMIRNAAVSRGITLFRPPNSEMRRVCRRSDSIPTMRKSPPVETPCASIW